MGTQSYSVAESLTENNPKPVRLKNDQHRIRFYAFLLHNTLHDEQGLQTLAATLVLSRAPTALIARRNKSRPYLWWKCWGACQLRDLSVAYMLKRKGNSDNERI